MALPTLEKTWVSAGMSLNGANGTSAADTVWKLKEALVNVTPGWTVAGSSDGTTFGMDGVDRWVTSSNVAVNRWIVLQNDAISTGFQVCFRPKQGGGGWFDSMTVSVSPVAGFTGGGATTKPTATDEETLVDGVLYRANGPEMTARANVWMSSDGECTRVVLCETAATRVFMLFDKAKNPVSGWTIPWVASVVAYSGASRVPEYNDLNDVTTYARSRVGATTMPLYFTSEGWVSSMMGERLTAGNDLDSNGYPLSAIGLASETVGVRGRHGQLYDIWWGSDAVADGGHYPGSTPRQFVQVGDIVLPWDSSLGSAILLS